MRRFARALALGALLLLLLAPCALAAPGDFLYQFGASDLPAEPAAVAVAPDGTVYASDLDTHRIVALAPDGTSLRAFGSYGSAQGQINYPRGVAVDGEGNIVVADTSNNRIQIFAPDGTFLRAFGSRGSAQGQLYYPFGVAVDGAGNIVVADTRNHRIQVFTPEGTFLRAFGTYGGAEGQLNYPSGVAVDGSGNIVVADTNNQRIQVFAPDGTSLRAFGALDPFFLPHKVAVAADGKVVVTNSNEHHILVFAPDGTFLSSVGAYGHAEGQLYYPSGVAVDGEGKIVVADTYNNRIQVFDGQGTLLAVWQKTLAFPEGLAVSGEGQTYVVDTNHSRIQIFAPDGTLLRTFGSYGLGQGQLRLPSGVAVNGMGNIVVADTRNNRIQIFTPDGTFLRAFGAHGSAPGQLSAPMGVTVDGSGNIVVADTYNSRIQIFTPDGTFLRAFGSYGSAQGQLNYPSGVAVDGSGNIVVVDTYNNRIQVFAPDGTFLHAFGIFGAAHGQLNYPPSGVAVDGAGNLVVADTLNHRIQFFAPDGTFLRAFGSYGSADGQFIYPRRVAVDGAGRIFVADTHNHRIQVFEGETVAVADAGEDQAARRGATVTLDGSGSYAVVEGELAYAWGLLQTPEGSAAALQGADTMNPSFVPDLPGDYVAQLVVSVGGVESAPDTVTVSTENVAPVAEAGDDQALTVLGTVTLDGSGSYDEENDPLAYLWSLAAPAGSSAQLSDPAAVAPTFEADVVGTYRATLTVTDSWGAASEADGVTVSFENLPPSADAGDDQNVFVGDTVALDGSDSSDPNGQSLAYTWTLVSRPEGSRATLGLKALFGTASFIADLPGTYVAQLTVSDGALQDTDTVTVVAITGAQAASLQVGYAMDAVTQVMDESCFANSNMKKPFLKKLAVVLSLIEQGAYAEARDKLEGDLLSKVDGCGGQQAGSPQKNDWLNCEGQALIYDDLAKAMETLKTLAP